MQSLTHVLFCKCCSPWTSSCYFVAPLPHSTEFFPIHSYAQSAPWMIHYEPDIKSNFKTSSLSYTKAYSILQIFMYMTAAKPIALTWNNNFVLYVTETVCSKAVQISCAFESDHRPLVFAREVNMQDNKEIVYSRMTNKPAQICTYKPVLNIDRLVHCQ